MSDMHVINTANATLYFLDVDPDPYGIDQVIYRIVMRGGHIVSYTYQEESQKVRFSYWVPREDDEEARRESEAA